MKINELMQYGIRKIENMNKMNFRLLDGGTGRELKRIGAPFRQPEWSALALIEAPNFVSKVHDNYISVGADVITTNSYAVVPFHIGQKRFDEQGYALASLAGKLARDSANRSEHKVFVAGSIPPALGSYRADLFNRKLAAPIWRIIVDGLSPHVDYWLAETLSSTEEASLLVEILGTDTKPRWISFTLDDLSSRDNPKIRSGESITAAAESAIAAGVEALLFNCCQPEVIAGAIRLAYPTVAAKGIRIGAYANAFPPQDESATANSTLLELRQDLTPEEYGRYALLWRSIGASIIGGCCGVGPEHILALRDLFPREAMT